MILYVVIIFFCFVPEQSDEYTFQKYSVNADTHMHALSNHERIDATVSFFYAYRLLFSSHTYLVVVN